ncbi:hypothetical protein IWW48_005080 [Coemansia sp. RSA 1200]|nr:hypothetical protein IWW48_005080 [Coemansia sp. RSA 1200]
MVDAESQDGYEGNVSSSHSPFSDSQINKISRRHCFVASTVTPVDVAGIRILLVPVGPVRREKMLHWVNAIAQFSRLSISDIMPHVEASLAAKYSGTSYKEIGSSGGSGAAATGMAAEGELRFLFSVESNDDHEYLEGLQTYRQILGVIGILDCQLCDSVADCYEEFLRTLSRHTTAVAYRCWAFDPLPEQLDDVNGVTVIPNAGGTLLFYLQTLLCDFAGTMLSALDLMVKSIEDKSGLQTPTENAMQSPFRRSSSSLEKDAVSPATSSVSDMHGGRRSIQETSTAAAQTMTRRVSQANFVRRESTQSLPAGDVTSGGGGGGGGAASTPGGSSQASSRQGRFGGEIDRDIVTANMGKPDMVHPSLSPSDSAREKKQVANNSMGDSASSGRLKKLQGDLYLMSGRLGEACNAFSTSIDVSRTFSDYLWQAVAMEGYCASLLQMCERQNERRLVNAHLSAIPKTSVSETAFSLASIRASMTRPSQANPQTAANVKGPAVATGSTLAHERDESSTGGQKDVPSEEFSLVEVLGRISELFGQIPLLYEKCYSFTPLLHAEACIREALVLFATRESFLDDPERALNSLLEIHRLHPRPMDTASQTTRDVVANVRNIPLRSVINDWLQRGWTSSYSSLALSDQLEMSSEISGLFRGLGYNRKSFFFLRQFLLMAVPILLRTSATGKFRSDLNYSSSSTPVRQSESSAHGYSAMSMFSDGASAFAAVTAAASAAAATAFTSHSQASQPPQALVNASRTARSSFESGESFTTTNPNPSDEATTVFNASLKEWATRSKPTLKQAVVACLDVLIHSFSSQPGRDGTLYPNHKLDRTQFGLHNGWLSIQTDTVRECLSIAEALPSYPHAIAAGFRLMSCLNELAAISPESQQRSLSEEQHMVRNYLNRTIAIYHQQYHFDSPTLQSNVSVEDVVPGQKHRPRVGGRDSAVVGGALDTLLVGIQFCVFPGNSVPVLLSNKANASHKEAPSLFLHNPSAQQQGDTPPLLAAHEDAYFIATLSNPFPFGLQLNEIGIIATIAPTSQLDDQAIGSGSDNAAVDSVQCFVPARVQGQVLLKITPKAPGQLKVKGIRLYLFRHLFVECMLAEEQEIDAKQRIRELPLKQRLETERNSLLGLDKPLPGSPSVQLSTMNRGYLLSTTVVPPLPRLSVIESSLSREESLSLYEGESRVLTLTLVNGSSLVAAERLLVAFEPLTDDKKPGDDQKTDFHMCDLVDSAFTYMHESDTLNVDPQQTYCLKVRIAGLSGLKGGEIIVRYGSSAVPEWARELRWPVSVTVRRLIVPSAGNGSGLWTKYSDLPPYIAQSFCSITDINDGSSKELVEALRAAYSDGDEAIMTAEHKDSANDLFYLVEINLQNMGSTDVQLIVETDLSAKPNTDTDSLHSNTMKDKDGRLVRTLAANMPGWRSLTRIVIPMRRTYLSNKTISSPIPGIEATGGPDKSGSYPWRTSLARDEGQQGQKDQALQEEWRHGDGIQRKLRQFVVSQTANMSKADLAMRRELYWRQLDIANRVRIRWECRQSGRTGYVDPRLLFVLDESDLVVVRPKSLRAQISIDGVAAGSVDRGVLRAKCITGRQSTVEFALTNKLFNDLDMDISVHAPSNDAAGVDESRITGGFGEEKEEKAPLVFAADAYYHANKTCSVDALATANVDFGLASSLPDSRIGFSKGRFVFRPTSGGLGTDGSLSTKDAYYRHIDSSLLAVPPLRRPTGLFFDDIQGMHLPEIAPGETRLITLPVYILHPGRYQLEYKISKRESPRRSTGDDSADDLVQGILVIEGTCE